MIEVDPRPVDKVSVSRGLTEPIMFLNAISDHLKDPCGFLIPYFGFDHVELERFEISA